MKRSKNIVVLLAGGKGARFENTIPKQFVKLAGKCIIEYTMKAFEEHDLVDEIYIVSSPEYHEKIWELVGKNGLEKVIKLVNSGHDRFASTYSAILALQDENNNTKVLFHDAVRPLINEETITHTIIALDSYEAVDTAIDATDTIIHIDDKREITEIPKRIYMKRGQTPQGFRLGTIRAAYEQAIEINRRDFTCDCGVVKEMMLDTPIYVVPSTEKNLKITYPIDLFIAEKYIQMGVDYGFCAINLSQLKNKNIVIFGHSSGIGKEIEMIARSHGANIFGASRSNGVDITNKNIITKFFNSLDCDIDIVINTAAILIKKPLEHMTYQEIIEITNINYLGAVNVAIASKQYLKKTNGMLINFTSSSYTRGRANYSMYSSSKAAVVNLTQALSEEWPDIKVNCINPERTLTPMRIKNFGIEAPETLLKPLTVAEKTLRIALSDVSGLIIDIKK